MGNPRSLDAVQGGTPHTVQPKLRTSSRSFKVRAGESSNCSTELTGKRGGTAGADFGEGSSAAWWALGV